MGCRCIFLLAFCVSALAQVATSRLEGFVQDPGGAMVPNASVTAVAAKTRNTVTVRSDGGGFYVFPSLAPDSYQVTAESPGFRKLVIGALELGAGAIVSQNLRLEVGQVSESVTVEARTEQIQTADSQVSRSVTLREVEGLPQLGRGPLSLINYQAGMAVDPNNSSFTRLNGTRQGSNTILIDGISGTEPVTPRSGNPGVAINTDTIEELRVVAAGGKAEYGRQGGGQIELITRTGTNRWSGSLSNFHRNTVLNANNWFNNASGGNRPSLVQNLFSGSIGGPVKKDKTFVFFNYQGRRTSNQVVRNRTVPTAEFRRGLFRWTAPGSGDIRSFDIAANDPRRIGVDKEIERQFGLMPLPNNFELGDRLNTAGFRWNVPAPSEEDAYTVRLDHHVTSTHRVFFRGSYQDTLVTDTVNNNEATFPGRPNATQPNKRKGFSIGSDWTVTPTLINELRMGYQNGDINFVRPDRIAGPMLTTNSWTDPLNTATSNRRHSPLRELTNNVSHLRGHHTIKGGVNVRMLRQFSTNDANIYPNVVLSTANGNVPPANIGPTGAAISSADRQRFENLYNDFLGRMGSVSVTYQTDLERYLPAGSPRVRNNDYLDFSWFVQDDWKVTPRLTLSYGLRWELFRAPRERDKLQGRFQGIERVTPLGGVDDLTVTRDPNWYVNDKNNFAPRFGFAWDPFGNGKTAIRGSYGIYYERSIGSVWNTVDGNTPGFTQAVVVFPNNTAGSDRRWSDGVPVAPIPTQTILRQPNNRQTTVVAFDPNLRTPYVQQFTFNIQREVFRNSVIDIGWVGTRGTGLFNWLDYNQLKIEGDFLNAFNEIARALPPGATQVPAGANIGQANTLARIFGTAQAAVNAIGLSVFQQGRAGVAADTTDRQNFQRYRAAGVSDFYLRNFPQFNSFWYGSNVGHSTYHGLQATFRRNTGALKFALNYSWSKSLDNLSSEGNGTTTNIDNFNLRLNRARGDFDKPHVFSATAVYNLPIGKGKAIGSNWANWADSIFGGWELGALSIWQSGEVFTVTSGRRLTGSAFNAFANYAGDRNIGTVTKVSDGVRYFSDEQIARFSFPGAGEIGTSGRNAFRSPRYFNVDLALSKTFRITERHRMQFRAEAYNATNAVNFDAPSQLSIATPQSLGRITAINGNARIWQGALTYRF